MCRFMYIFCFNSCYETQICICYMAEALRLSEVCFLIDAQRLYLQSTHARENIYKQMFRYTVA
jgi:hypothetical protein